jgi:hypothetical protein
MEHYKTIVNDKSYHVTKETPHIITLEGYKIPMCVRNGLMYIELRPFTDKEWEDNSLPKIHLTSLHHWDPSVLDMDVPPEWYQTQVDNNEYFRNSLYDENGEYRDGRNYLTPPNDNVGEVEVNKTSTPKAVTSYGIRAHLAEIIKDELDDEFMVFQADGTTYEHIDHTARMYEVNKMRRRSPRNHAGTDATQPKLTSKKKELPSDAVEHAKSDQSPSQPKSSTVAPEGFRSDEGQELRTDYNNPAKTDATAEEKDERRGSHGPRYLRPTKRNYEEYARFFPGIGLENIKATFEATTQYASKGAIPGISIKSRIKSPNPVLNIPRRHEPVATDTIYGPRGVPAVDDGSTAAQFFIGRKSMFRTVIPCGKSDKDFPKVLAEVIRKYGAMDQLISDRAAAEISQQVEDILRTLYIDHWQSEPHKKDQNFAERGWQDTQRVSNLTLNMSGAPDYCWLLALKYVSFIQNRVSLQSLNGRTPYEWLYGQIPDISIILQFVFYEVVYYKSMEEKYGKPTELVGRFVGFSEDSGHGMTFLVLTDDLKIIRRSDIRSGKKGGAYRNIRALENATTAKPRRPVITHLPSFARNIEHGKPVHPENESVKVETVTEEEETTASPQEVRAEEEVIEMFATDSKGEQEPSNPDKPAQENDDSDPTEEEIADKIHGEPESDREHGENMKVIDVEKLLGRTFINDPDENQEQHRVQVDDISPTGEFTADGSEELYRFRCKAGDTTFEEIMTYNKMLDWCDRDLDKDDMYKFDAILGHRRSKTAKSGWELLVQWSSGEVTWNDYNLTFAGDPITVSLYVEANGLLKHFPGCKRYIKNKKTLSRMAHQVRLKNFRNRPKYKFGEQVPRNHEEAMFIDYKNGNNRWKESEEKERKELFDHNSFKDLGIGADVPEGFTKIRCHFVYDVKHDGRYKSRFVAGGHMTTTPVESSYSGVVSIPGVRIVTFLAELNDMELWSTDISNAYLESVTKEKVCFVAGPEFHDLEGHLMVIYKAQYGLKSSGKRWHDRLHDVLRSMGFTPSKAEEDIWMRDCGDHYEYIAVYVDDLLIASKNPQGIIDQLEAKPHQFKLKGTGPVTYHLGNDYVREEDGTLRVGPCKYIEKMVATYERMYGKKPSMKASSPLERNDHPELDDSPIVDDDGIRQYQSLIGILQWAITLGRFDIATAVMTMSGFRVAPREQHLERVKRICGYLYKMRNGYIRIRTDEPDFSDLPFKDYEWSRTVYGDVREETPSDCPRPLGKPVVMWTCKDANLYHDLMTGRAVTGIIHFLNQTPVDWYSKKQATVETATYGSEFSAARTAIQQIAGLRLTLRYLGVPIKGGAKLFGDNESVITSSTQPHSPLGKRHHGLAYHYCREAVASKMVEFQHVRSEFNLADIVSKHWAYASVWPQLQPVLFWKGDTADLFDKEDVPEQGKGSDKSSTFPGKPEPAKEG